MDYKGIRDKNKRRKRNFMRKDDENQRHEFPQNPFMIESGKRPKQKEEGGTTREKIYTKKKKKSWGDDGEGTSQVANKKSVP